MFYSFYCNITRLERGIFLFFPICLPVSASFLVSVREVRRLLVFSFEGSSHSHMDVVPLGCGRLQTAVQYSKDAHLLMPKKQRQEEKGLSHQRHNLVTIGPPKRPYLLRFCSPLPLSLIHNSSTLHVTLNMQAFVEQVRSKHSVPATNSPLTCPFFHIS